MPSFLTTSLHTKAHDRILIDRDITGRYKGAKFCSVCGRGECNNKQRPHPQKTKKGKKVRGSGNKTHCRQHTQSPVPHHMVYKSCCGISCYLTHKPVCTGNGNTLLTAPICPHLILPLPGCYVADGPPILSN